VPRYAHAFRLGSAGGTGVTGGLMSINFDDGGTGEGETIDTARGEAGLLAALFFTALLAAPLL